MTSISSTDSSYGTLYESVSNSMDPFSACHITTSAEHSHDSASLNNIEHSLGEVDSFLSIVYT